MLGFVSMLAVMVLPQEEVKFEPVETISTGGSFAMDKALIPERPNLVVFFQETSSADKDLVQQLSEKAVKSKKVALRLVKLKNLDQPAAKEHGVMETPTLIVFDRFGTQLARTSRMDEIDAAMVKALKLARIKWVSESDPEAESTYRMMGGGKQPVADIMKTMSLQPQWMELVARLAGIAHFSPNTNLPKKTKEMIATYVSAINHCKF
jgi:hypothetical protein